MTKCRNCDRATQLFLCSRCTDELRDMLTGLAIGQELSNGRRAAGWIEHLAESALGQTRLGESSRRSPRYRRRLDGDKPLASQIELLPGERWDIAEGPARAGEHWPIKIPSDAECDLAKARQERERTALRHALGAARINLRASELLEYAHSVLVEWCRDICETRGAQVPRLATTSKIALWLARNVSAIATDEGAAVCYREIQQIVVDIERVINLPVPPMFLGPCPTEKGRRQQCTYALQARRDAIEVTCPQCQTVHNVGELLVRLISETEGYLFTLAELVNWILPAVREYVPQRTLQHWAAGGRLQARDYGTDGEPKYLLADVRKLRDGKPQKATTGAAARQ